MKVYVAPGKDIRHGRQIIMGGRMLFVETIKARLL